MTANVVCLGPKYTFSHEAAQEMFPHAEFFFEHTPQSLFNRVDSGEMDYGILPAENSTTGIVVEFFPLLVDQDFIPPSKEVHVHIVKELYLPINQHLISRKNLSIGEIQKIYTNNQPLLQCLDWIQTNLPNIEIEITASTADAAEKLLKDPNGVCIGGDFLVKKEKLIKVKEKIQSNPRNITRFFAISAKPNRNPSRHNKTTFAITIPNRVGSLLEVLKVIAAQRINLTHIQTFPVHDYNIFSEDFKDWFIIDVATHRYSEEFKNIELKLKVNDLIESFKFLGSYQAGYIKETLQV